jgi:hypothetical protein
LAIVSEITAFDFRQHVLDIAGRKRMADSRMKNLQLSTGV